MSVPDVFCLSLQIYSSLPQSSSSPPFPCFGSQEAALLGPLHPQGFPALLLLAVSCQWRGTDRRRERSGHIFSSLLFLFSPSIPPSFHPCYALSEIFHQRSWRLKGVPSPRLLPHPHWVPVLLADPRMLRHPLWNFCTC